MSYKFHLKSKYTFKIISYETEQSQWGTDPESQVWPGETHTDENPAACVAALCSPAGAPPLLECSTLHWVLDTIVITGDFLQSGDRERCAFCS